MQYNSVITCNDFVKKKNSIAMQSSIIKTPTVFGLKFYFRQDDPVSHNNITHTMNTL